MCYCPALPNSQTNMYPIIKKLYNPYMNRNRNICKQFVAIFMMKNFLANNYAHHSLHHSEAARFGTIVSAQEPKPKPKGYGQMDQLFVQKSCLTWIQLKPQILIFTFLFKQGTFYLKMWALEMLLYISLNFTQSQNSSFILPLIFLLS